MAVRIATRVHGTNDWEPGPVAAPGQSVTKDITGMNLTDVAVEYKTKIADGWRRQESTEILKIPTMRLFARTENVIGNETKRHRLKTAYDCFICKKQIQSFL